MREDDARSEVADHYEQLLAEHYTWMFGASFSDLVREQRDVLEAAGVSPTGSGAIAADLGCGSGFQCVALAQLGYASVIGVDFSEQLLSELATRSGEYPAIRGLRADLTEDLDGILEAGSAQAVVCMGDTLTHLPDRESVRRLFDSAFGMLAAGGRLVLTFRDLSVPLLGLDRFLPVFGDDDTVMTCFVEEEGPDAVRVHDLVHHRGPDNAWTLNKSSYLKLRFAPSWVVAQLSEAGFVVDDPADAPRRMRLITARRR